MRRIIWFFQLLAVALTHPLHNPFEHIYPLAYPHTSQFSDINYGYTSNNYEGPYGSFAPNFVNEYEPYFSRHRYSPFQDARPTLNVLADLPFAVSKEFSVVPLFIVAKNSMNMIPQGDIESISNDQSTIRVTTRNRQSIEVTPAVRIVLEKPIVVGSLKTGVLFPSEVQILHDGVRIPIRIGAVIAPVLPQTYVSPETPVTVGVVYAVPTKPIRIKITIEQDDGLSPLALPSLPNVDKQQKFNDKSQQLVIVPNEEAAEGSQDEVFGALSHKPDYINDAQAVLVPEQESVVVDSDSGPALPPKNVTVLEFPQAEAEPNLDVDEEDDELVNRNPPLVLAPAGIVQSTQPESHVEPFHNDKESSYLETLREEAKKKRL